MAADKNRFFDNDAYPELNIDSFDLIEIVFGKCKIQQVIVQGQCCHLELMEPLWLVSFNKCSESVKL